jgi:hypothetical protein
MTVPLYEQHKVYYAAFQVQHIFLVGALGEYAQLYAHNPEFHLGSILARNMEFINTLMQQSDERFTYDYRVTSRPNTLTPNHGIIVLSLVCAIRASRTEAQAHATSMFHLLNAQFKDVQWQVCNDVASVIPPMGDSACGISGAAQYICGSGSPDSVAFIGVAAPGIHAPTLQRTAQMCSGVGKSTAMRGRVKMTSLDNS